MGSQDARGRAGRLKAPVSSWRTRGRAALPTGEPGEITESGRLEKRIPQVHVHGSDPKRHPSDFDTSGQTTQISGWPLGGTSLGQI